MNRLDTGATGTQPDKVIERADGPAPKEAGHSSLQCLRAHEGKQAQEPGALGGSSARVTVQRPEANFTNGILTVDPHDAPMRQVLNAIGARAGFNLDLPATGMDGKVFDRVGPLPLREALVELLYGSGFNYIIKTASDNPQDVKYVSVTARESSQMATTAARPNEPADGIQEDQALYGGFADPSPQDQPVVPAAVAERPSAPQAGNVPGVPAGFNLKQAAEEAHKTPAEILDELQKRQLEILDAQAPPQ